MDPARPVHTPFPILVAATLALFAGGCASYGTRGLGLGLGPTLDMDGAPGVAVFVEAMCNSTWVIFADHQRHEAAPGVEERATFFTAHMGGERRESDSFAVLGLGIDSLRVPWLVGIGAGVQRQHVALEARAGYVFTLHYANEWQYADGKRQFVGLGPQLRCAAVPGADRAQCGAFLAVHWLRFFAEGTPKH